jgi:hypothetical protein
VSGDYGQGAVDLFGEDKRGHLVWKRHLPERKQQVGAFAAGFREAIRWAHAKDKLLVPGVLEFAKPTCKLGGTELLPPRIEKDQKAGASFSVQGGVEAFLIKKYLFFYGGVLPNPLRIGAEQWTPFGALTSPADSVKN